MLYFLYGSDGYLVRQRKNQLVADFCAATKQRVIEYFDVTEPEQSEHCFNSFKMISLFTEARCVVIENSISANQLSTLQPYLKTNQNDLVILIETQSAIALKKKAPEEFRQASSYTTETFGALPPIELATWLKEYCQQKQCQLSSQALTQLVRYYTPRAKQETIDSWLIANELAKLCNYAQTQANKTISLEAVDALVTIPLATKVFDLLDAVSNNQQRTALTLLRQYLEQAIDPYYILSMLLFQFRTLLTIKALSDIGRNAQDIIQQTKSHPYVLQKAMVTLRAYPLVRLKERFTELVQLDQHAKAGEIILEDGLYSFILS